MLPLRQQRRSQVSPPAINTEVCTLRNGEGCESNPQVALLVYYCAVPILKEASVELRRRLLDLFPVATLRASFEVKGSKETVAGTIAKNADPANLKKIAEFVDSGMALCKQHIHIFGHDGNVDMPADFAGAERVISAPSHSLYIVKRTYHVVKLSNTPQYGSVDFLWPIRIEVKNKYLLARFAVLERNIPTYFETGIMIRSKSPSEEPMTATLLSDGTVFAADLNKGIKSLWAKDLIDANRLKWDMPYSSDSKTMNGAKGLKKTNPAEYEAICKRPLRMCSFIGDGTHKEVGLFSANPTTGFIGFTRYSKDGSNGDALIEQILADN